MGYDTEADRSCAGMKIIGTPTQPYHNMTDASLNGSMLTKNGAPIRPLTAAYRAVSSDQQVGSMRHTPLPSSFCSPQSCSLASR